MEKYNPQDIEPKWIKKWEDIGLYKTSEKTTKLKYYNLVMFPYSSGDLHIGHWYNFAPADIHARYKRMLGLEVLNPMGFDSFGLPAENAAIKKGVHPHEWTEENVSKMIEQLKTTGNSYEWGRVVVASRADYYKWTQWMFLLMYKKGLAYRTKALANWCPSCQTVLANEQVENGVCWRCGSQVTQKEIEQWMFSITKYADRLLKDLEKIDWPEQTITMQKNWIGRSEGLEIDFALENSDEKIRVFTTRADTILGATFMVLAPEHPLALSVVSSERKKEVEDYIKEASRKRELERMVDEKDTTGVFTGSYCINPISNERIPIYVSEYVLMGYGTGAIMGVPAHDTRDNRFARKYGLEIREVIQFAQSNKNSKSSEPKIFEGFGTLMNSGKYSGKNSNEVIESIKEYVEIHHIGNVKVNYHLRDWVVSRQRYWGAPIPIIYCEDCGIVPVSISELPVELPYDVDYTPKGTSPLATSSSFVNVACPKCGKSAKRETDTMDTFVDSSWYFLRFPTPNLEEAAFDKSLVDFWLPVDMYIGGSEHTVLHLLYSRFFTKVLFDENLISFDEPFFRLRHQGMILGPDGAKMSKSKGNVINPDDLVKTYGADTVRTYLAFMGPYDQGGPWSYQGIEGIYRYINRVWTLTTSKQAHEKIADKNDLRIMNRTIKKVSKDIDILHFNTAVSTLMEWLNYLNTKKSVSKQEIEVYLKLLAPFAPFITEEIWSGMGNTESIHTQNWPEFDDSLIAEDEITLIVQINGKVRDRVGLPINTDQDKALEASLKLSNVKRYIGNRKDYRIIFVPNKLINLVLPS